MPTGVKSFLVTMLLAILAVSCESSVNKNRTYYTNRYSFGCYSAADLEQNLYGALSGFLWPTGSQRDILDCKNLRELSGTSV